MITTGILIPKQANEFGNNIHKLCDENWICLFPRQKNGFPSGAHAKCNMMMTKDLKEKSRTRMDTVTNWILG